MTLNIESHGDVHTLLTNYVLPCTDPIGQRRVSKIAKKPHKGKFSKVYLIWLCSYFVFTYSLAVLNIYDLVLSSLIYARVIPRIYIV